MTIRHIETDKRQFMELLLLAEEEESVVHRYLDHGDLFALYDGDVKSVCVVIRESGTVCELKYIATDEQYQRQGYGKQLLAYVCEQYKSVYETMILSTGNSPRTLRFYQQCGFVISHRIENFFLYKYDYPIIDCGVQITDIVYFSKKLREPDTLGTRC